MHKFISIFMAFLVSLVVAFVALFITSQYVDSTDHCTVVSKADIQIRERRHAYRIHTSDCGSFSFSALPLRGIESAESKAMWSRINVGEQYKVTYIREGFGIFSVNPSVVDIDPTYYGKGTE